MEKLSDYLRISEAAEYLGVSPNALRNWVNAGKIAAVRHPVNDYRLFKRADLDVLLEQVAASKKNAQMTSGRGAIGRRPGANGIATLEHHYAVAVRVGAART